jgi:hypothetical protein
MPTAAPPTSNATGDQRRAARWAVLILLTLGVALWLALPLGPGGTHVRLAWWRGIAALVAAAIALLPAIEHAVGRLRLPTRHGHVALIVAILAGLYFLLTATLQHRDFFAKTHDECSYLIQMRMLARGRLWMPQHELADFFDSFYLLAHPVYASQYFPGTAMLFVPALWLGLPPWIGPLIVAAAIVGLIYRIIAETLDHSGAGLLAAFLAVSLSWYRMHSIMLMSQLPTLLMGLIMIWAWLRWRVARHRVWLLLLIGVAAGWAAITRPLDALCFAVPVGIAILAELRSQPRRLLAAAALIVVGAIPFLAIQAVLNHGVSGSWTRSPFSVYADRDMPGTSYGFHPLDPAARPQSVIVQKQLGFQYWTRPFIERHQPGRIVEDWWRNRLPLIADVTLPARGLLVLLPVGVMGLFVRRAGEGEPGRGQPGSERCEYDRRPAWVLLATLALFLLGYVGYTFFLEHYALVIVPAIALLVLAAIRTIGGCWPRARLPLAAAVVALGITNLPEVNRQVSDEPFHAKWMAALHEASETHAIVLFAFDIAAADPDRVMKISQEPVYNTDVAWPDDAPLIRAHDLGAARNAELYRYYARIAPDRMIYRISRRTGEMTQLGTARELAAAATGGSGGGEPSR